MAVIESTDGTHVNSSANVVLPRNVLRASVESEPLDVAGIEALVESPDAGAAVSFVGWVRRHDRGREVTSLAYSSHPRSNAEAVRIATQVARRMPGVRALALSHRVGVLQVGDVAIVCAASADHRDQAFDACRALVETVKRELPIWKHQTFGDGSDEWVGFA